jgi:trans-aconitate methyltransferase
MKAAIAENPWDALAPQHMNEAPATDAWYDVDNTLLAEPVILDYLASHVSDPSKVRVLDFGCGTGQFANRLSQLGYSVQGVDSSAKMIEAANAAYSADVSFTVGDSAALPAKPTYDVVVSVMTLQFVAEFQPTMQRLAAALQPGGLLVLAVFNPGFISDWIKSGSPDYVGFDSADNPTMGTLQFGATAVPVHVRTATEYNKQAAEQGLALELEAYPVFNPEFLAKYPVDGPTEHAEHMILCFQKVE